MYPDYKMIAFPYTNKDSSVIWVVEFPDLPGCSAVGRSVEEALKESMVACKLWLDEYYDQYQAYPNQKKNSL